MSEWQSVSTVESIMTTKLTTWNPEEKPKAVIQREMADSLFDTVPIWINGAITGMLYAKSGKEIPLTHDLFISRDTSIPDALQLLANSKHPSFLVLYGQAIVGMVTPSDFNKVSARSFFYNLLAMYEMEIADRTREFYAKTEFFLDILKPVDKTRAQYRKSIKQRSSGVDRNQFGLDLIRTLYLSEFETLIHKDKTFREALGFESDEFFSELYNGINDMRTKVMHATRPLLDNRNGIEELSERTRRLIELLERLTLQQETSPLPR